MRKKGKKFPSHINFFLCVYSTNIQNIKPQADPSNINVQTIIRVNFTNTLVYSPFLSEHLQIIYQLVITDSILMRRFINPLKLK